MPKIHFSVTLNLKDEGKVDLEELEANMNEIMQQAQDEGVITPDWENHAQLVDVDIMLHGFVDKA